MDSCQIFSVVKRIFHQICVWVMPREYWHLHWILSLYSEVLSYNLAFGYCELIICHCDCEPCCTVIVSLQTQSELWNTVSHSRDRLCVQSGSVCLQTILFVTAGTSWRIVQSTDGHSKWDSELEVSDLRHLFSVSHNCFSIANVISIT